MDEETHIPRILRQPVILRAGEFLLVRRAECEGEGGAARSADGAPGHTARVRPPSTPLRERRGMSAIGCAAARASVIHAGNRVRQPSAPSTTKWTTPADQLTTSRPADSSGSFTTSARPAQKGLAFRSASSIVSSSERGAHDAPSDPTAPSASADPGLVPVRGLD